MINTNDKDVDNENSVQLKNEKMWKCYNGLIIKAIEICLQRKFLLLDIEI